MRPGLVQGSEMGEVFSSVSGEDGFSSTGVVAVFMTFSSSIRRRSRRRNPRNCKEVGRDDRKP